jgi:hypothetical protein
VPAAVIDLDLGTSEGNLELSYRRIDQRGAGNVQLVLNAIGGVLMLWVIVKASIIGYYSDQIVSQLVIPAVIGLACIGAAKLASD